MTRPAHRPPHAPTPEQRQIVELAAVVGIPHHDIGPLVGVSIKTLLKHYRKELALGKTRANVKVGGSLYNAAIKGNVAAMIFWMKAQAGWREVQHHEHAGPGGKPIALAAASASISDEDAMKVYLKLVSKEE